MIIYSLIAMRFGSDLMEHWSILLQTLGYIVLGVLWIPVGAVIIRWMTKPDET